MQFTIDSKICRAVAKVGLNYFIYWNGASIAFLPDFDPIREFIRYGTKMKLPYFQIVEKPILEGEPIEGKRRLGHLITVNWADDKSSVLAQISLFNLNTYAVCLSHQFSGPKPNIRKGHFFNVGNSKIYELGAREINAGGKIQ